ncbi:MAG: cell division protein FtsZ [Tannerellaceae bacterium]|jgi:cell division protein FtsZ|nr:cell division protein FtsZ [Tannerellaceae bacterium]
MDRSILEFDLPRDRLKIIKVIGVGGGGGNAVTHMYHEGIRDVSFLLCNTDIQALNGSDVPDQLVLGESVTHGLGAGNNPKIAKKAALASEKEIKARLSDGTKMVFITAGMGGGTGTGAAPVIARFAKEMGILTVGIVTIPFKFERDAKIRQALYGVEAMRKNVDALLVINNEGLIKNYARMSVKEAFAKANDTLTVAAKSIAEIVTVQGTINLDFADVERTLKNGGVALMSNGYGEGEGRFQIAFRDALNSPLLNNADVFKAKKILFNIYYSNEAEMLTEEMDEITIFMDSFEKDDLEVIWGLCEDDALGKKVKLTILATGFGVSHIPEMEKIQGLPEEDEAEVEPDKPTPDQIDLLKDTYYGRDGDFMQSKIFILQANELDDDILINLLEENPTCKRDVNFASRMRDKAFNEKHPGIGGNTTHPSSGNGNKKTPPDGDVIYFS